MDIIGSYIWSDTVGGIFCNSSYFISQLLYIYTFDKKKLAFLKVLDKCCLLFEANSAAILNYIYINKSCDEMRKYIDCNKNMKWQFFFHRLSSNNIKQKPSKIYIKKLTPKSKFKISWLKAYQEKKIYNVTGRKLTHG